MLYSAVARSRFKTIYNCIKLNNYATRERSELNVRLQDPLSESYRSVRWLSLSGVYNA